MSVEVLIKKVSNLMEQRMANYDSSHDAHHVYRVRDCALKLANTLEESVDMVIVELGALLHDMNDHKYGSTDENMEQIKEILTAQNCLTPYQIDQIISIVNYTSYSTEKKLEKSGQLTSWHRTCRELHCVQDADRLDAIGSIGILRCAAFSGAHNTCLYKEDKNAASCYGHFFEKLLTLKDTLKTKAGKEAGEKRTKIMQQLVDQLEVEMKLSDI